jgi:hypothetical protein
MKNNYLGPKRAPPTTQQFRSQRNVKTITMKQNKTFTELHTESSMKMK